MVKLTPAMGWNSWNVFGKSISEQMVKEVADAMVSEGLLEKGYEYLVLDDSWQLEHRDENGKLVPDPEKFPNGMKAVYDYVHSKGLKLGLYSCAGTMTCCNYAGSYEHEFEDAATFAEWGIDFLKYDYCNHSPVVHGKYLYQRMGIALENCGRDILFSACNWGWHDASQWMKTTGASMWRSTGDLMDSWESVCDRIREHEAAIPYAGVGCFPDLDMLIVGMYGKGNVGIKGCSDLQYKTHFSLWAFLGSPLMIGCDIRNMSEATKEILTNEELIRINQDTACRQPVKITGLLKENEQQRVLQYSKQLDNGDIALGFFNLSDIKSVMRMNLDEIGLPHSTGKTLLMKNVWTGEETLVKNSFIFDYLEPYSCAVFRCKVVDEVY